MISLRNNFGWPLRYNNTRRNRKRNKERGDPISFGVSRINPGMEFPTLAWKETFPLRIAHYSVVICLDKRFSILLSVTIITVLSCNTLNLSCLLNLVHCHDNLSYFYQLFYFHYFNYFIVNYLLVICCLLFISFSLQSPFSICTFLYKYIYLWLQACLVVQITISEPALVTGLYIYQERLVLLILKHAQTTTITNLTYQTTEQLRKVPKCITTQSSKFKIYIPSTSWMHPD